MKSTSFFTFFLIIVLSQPAQAQWTPLTTGTTRSIDKLFFPSVTTGYVVPLNGPMLRTRDGGNTWDSLPGFQFSATSIMFNDIWFVSDSTGFVSTRINNTTKLFRTADMGGSWTDVTPAPNLMGVIRVQFLSPNKGFAYSNWSFDDRFWHTSDGGNTWQEDILGSSLSTGTTAMPDMFIVDDSTGFVYGGDGTFLYRGRIARTLSGGNNWNFGTLQAQGSIVDAMHFPNRDTGYAFGRNGGLYRTLNTGDTWDSISGLDPASREDLFFRNGGTGYFVSGNHIYKTTDAGMTWNNQYTGNSGLELNSIFFTSDGTGYAAGSDGLILKTTNGGGPVGFEELQEGRQLQFFPNPTTGWLTIKNAGGREVSVCDLQGRELMLFKDGSNMLNLESLQPGMYLLRLSGTAVVQKVIRN